MEGLVFKWVSIFISSLDLPWGNLRQRPEEKLLGFDYSRVIADLIFAN